MWHCITGCLYSLETTDITPSDAVPHPQRMETSSARLMEPHFRRWQSSRIIVFRVQCKNEGRSLQICYSECVIVYLLASQQYLAETLVYVWEFLTVGSVAKCQEHNRLYTSHTSYSKSLAVLQMYLSSPSCAKYVARPSLYLHCRLVEILAQSTDIPCLI
jgi:hypothetical protein